MTYFLPKVSNPWSAIAKLEDRTVAKVITLRAFPSSSGYEIWIITATARADQTTADWKALGPLLLRGGCM